MTETQEQGYKYWTDSGKAESLKSMVLMILSNSFDMTDRELSNETGYDINAINRARYDLIRDGYVCESQKRRCSITNSYVQAWKLGKQEQKKELSNTIMNKIKQYSETANDYQRAKIREWFK